MTRTLYYDAKDNRWVLVVMNGNRVKHHSFPKTIQSEKDAKKHAKEI
jgi:hypothetical protein